MVRLGRGLFKCPSISRIHLPQAGAPFPVGESMLAVPTLCGTRDEKLQLQRDYTDLAPQGSIRARVVSCL